MWNGFNVEMNYKECLYKCGLKEKREEFHIWRWRVLKKGEEKTKWKLSTDLSG